MKIGILGTRGIPNYYGGFEQLAQYLSVGLVEKGHDVYVYCSHLHPFQDRTWNGVNLIHCKDYEDKIGTTGMFFYDLNCIRDSRKRDFDVLLQLGYTSSSVWGKLLPKKTKIISNMDGLEWKRSKYSPMVQKFLKYAEKWAVLTSDVLVSDSIGIQNYIKDKYSQDSEYIAYGAEVFDKIDENVLNNWELKRYEYYILVARMVPENNIEMILDGYSQSHSKFPFIVIGKLNNSFAKKMQDKFKSNKNIYFVGGVYNQEELSNIRYFSRLYFHGHSVGGTNPSLLEAMGSSALIVAHNNIFNKSILSSEAYYFSNSDEVATIIDEFSDCDDLNRKQYIQKNISKVRTKYSWEKIIDEYEKVMKESIV